MPFIERLRAKYFCVEINQDSLPAGTEGKRSTKGKNAMKTIRQSFFRLREVSHQPLLLLLFVWTIMMVMSWSLLTLTD